MDTLRVAVLKSNWLRGHSKRKCLTADEVAERLGFLHFVTDKGRCALCYCVYTWVWKYFCRSHSLPRGKHSFKVCDRCRVDKEWSEPVAGENFRMVFKGEETPVFLCVCNENNWL